MIRFKDDRPSFKSHLANECRPGTTLVAADGNLWLCAISDDTQEHVWIRISGRGDEVQAVICDADKVSEAYGKICDLDITVR